MTDPNTVTTPIPIPTYTDLDAAMAEVGEVNLPELDDYAPAMAPRDAPPPGPYHLQLPGSIPVSPVYAYEDGQRTTRAIGFRFKLAGAIITRPGDRVTDDPRYAGFEFEAVGGKFSKLSVSTLPIRTWNRSLKKMETLPATEVADLLLNFGLISEAEAAHLTINQIKALLPQIVGQETPLAVWLDLEGQYKDEQHPKAFNGYVKVYASAFKQPNGLYANRTTVQLTSGTEQTVFANTVVRGRGWRGRPSGK